MTDYIRKGVELADGFEVYNSSGLDRIYQAEWATHQCYPAIDNCHQWALDALAAQLVRQVDALGRVSLTVGPNATQVLFGDLSSQNQLSKSVDRTMNTIKAIVDSKVLEDD